MKKRIATLLLCTILCNCSYFLVKRVPANPPVGVQCTTSVVAPVLDGLAGAYWLASLGLVAVNPEVVEQQGVNPGFAAVLYGIFLVNRSIATGYGFSQTSKCKAAKARVVPDFPTGPTSPTPKPIEPTPLPLITPTSTPTAP